METITQRARLINEIKIILGGTMIDLELEEQELNMCITLAVDRYRQRSDNSIEESFAFLDVQPDVNIYTLPDEIQEVRACYRSGVGGSTGLTVDPFSLSYAQTFYSVLNPSQMGGNGPGTLALYDFANQYINTLGRLFGRDLMFTWDASTKKITFHRKFYAPENVALHVYNARPEEILLGDVFAKPWLRSMSVAQAKMMLGQARGKFASYAGPQGGVTMNGEALKQEGLAESEKLEEELKNLIDQDSGYGIIIG